MNASIPKAVHIGVNENGQVISLVPENHRHPFASRTLISPRMLPSKKRTTDVQVSLHPACLARANACQAIPGMGPGKGGKKCGQRQRRTGNLQTPSAVQRFESHPHRSLVRIRNVKCVCGVRFASNAGHKRRQGTRLPEFDSCFPDARQPRTSGDRSSVSAVLATNRYGR